MKFKFCVVTAFLSLGFINIPSALASNCGNFTLNADLGSTGLIMCDRHGDAEIHFVNSLDVEKVHGLNKTTLFTGVTDLTSNISGIVDNAPKNSGFGSFSVDPNVWNNWSSIYIGLNVGDDYALYKLTHTINSGVWQTSLNHGSGTALNSYIAFATAPSAVPIPAAVWLFGSGLVGLFGFIRRKPRIALKG